jgi:GNAT superfamily N-acetyltransferase
MLLFLFRRQTVGCGCFKNMIKNTIEIKRMFVSPDVRGMGLAQTILLELEAWARFRIFFSVLETYTKQKEAIVSISKKHIA